MGTYCLHATQKQKVVNGAHHTVARHTVQCCGASKAEGRTKNIEILQIRVKQIREDASRTNVCGVVQLYNSLYKLTSEALTKARGLRDRLLGLDKVALRKHMIFT